MPRKIIRDRNLRRRDVCRIESRNRLEHNGHIGNTSCKRSNMVER